MATRSLRNRGPSRLSSPAITNEAEQAYDNDVHRNGHDGPEDWVEPPVRRLPPSFQDHRGLERLGVLELQQPLGEPPSQKLLQRLKLNFRASNRASPMQNEEVVTPSVESERLDFGSPREAERISEPPPPAPPPQEDQTVFSSPPRGRPAKRDADEMRQPAYIMDFAPFQPPVSTSPGDAAAAKPISIQEQLRQDRVSAYIDRAIEEAERNGDLGLLPGLQKVKDKAFRQRSLWVVLDAIAHNSPDEEQLSVFKRYIKKGVKRHRRQSALSGSSVQPSFLGIQSQSPGQPVVAADDSHSTLSPAAPTLIQAPTFTPTFRTRPSPSQNLHTHPAHPPVYLSPTSRRSKMDSGNERSPGQLASSNTRRRKRSGTNSSTSSLSSARSIPEEFAPDQPEIEAEDDNADERPRSKNLKGGQRQGSDRAKLRSSGISHPNPKHPFHAFPDVAKLTAKKFKKPREDSDYDPADVERRRKRFEDDIPQDYNYRHHDTVNLREPLAYLDDDYPATSTAERIPPPPVVHTQPVSAKTTKLDTSFESQSAPNKGLPNCTSRKRNHDEMEDDDDDLSSVLSSTPEPIFVPPPPVGVRLSSRANTPRMAKHSAVNKARKSARVMISPNKPKNGGITAGISRVGQSKEAVIGDGAESGAEENDEFCASCGGEGTLLCCDGCSNSLHHSCLEPPLDPDHDVEGEWFCPQCQAKRNKNVKESSGILGKIVGRVQTIIPKAFALPMEVRDYFDGVRTGEGGEYEEFGQARTQTAKMNRAGFFEEPNYKESRDGKGKLMTCYQCGKSANGRDLIPCDFCEHKWHLDCLDPPLAVPPRRRIGDKVNATWRCPLHVEQDLAGIGRQAEAAPGDLGRHPRPRKPKNSKPVDVSMPRGFKNNGVIEVELMKDEMPGIKDIAMNGGVFRLPEMGIRLDFIDRVKKSWFEDESFARLAGRPPKMKQRMYRATGSPLYHKPDHLVFKMEDPDYFTGAQAVSFTKTAEANAKLRRKTYPEQQAALNLVSLANNTPGYDPDSIADLTNTLISEAPQSAQLAIQQGEKGTLLQLQELLQRRLNILDGIDMPLPAPPAYPTPAPHALAQPVLKPKPMYQPIQPMPPQPPMMQHAPGPYTSGSMSNGNGYGPRPPVQHNYSSFVQNQQNQSQYHASIQNSHHRHSHKQSPIQASPTTPQQQNPGANAFDAALDPRLFGGVNLGYVDDDRANDADVEMDGS